MYIFVLQTNTYIMGYEIILETKIVIKKVLYKREWVKRKKD